MNKKIQKKERDETLKNLMMTHNPRKTNIIIEQNMRDAKKSPERLTSQEEKDLIIILSI